MMAEATQQMIYGERRIAKFRRDYYRHGKLNLDIQVPHLVRLAEYYSNRYKHLKPQHWTDCLKAHSLYNSALARNPQLEGLNQKAFDIQKAYWGEESDITYEEQTLITTKLLTKLRSIRDNLSRDLESANKRATAFTIDQSFPEDMMSEFTICMQKNTTDCTDEMVKFAGMIIDESVKILKIKPPCDFSVVGLGSLARGETTPYSDLEYLFLVDVKSPEIEEYFKCLAITSYFLIGNLKETNLKYMHIKELQGWFEDRCKSGFKIDGLSPGAGNIPTGNGQQTQQNHFILTPAELVTKYHEKLNNPDKEEALRGDLTAMLTYMKSIYDYGEVKNSRIQYVRTYISKPIISDTHKEDCCESSFKIDGLSLGAGNIPTGSTMEAQHNHFILTPAELVTKYHEKSNNPWEEEAVRGDLTAMLTYMNTYYNHGDVGLSQFEHLMSNIPGSISSAMRMEANKEMLWSDITKFDFAPDSKVHNKGFTVDVKKEFYRFPSILLLDIAIVSECVSDSAWTTCDKLLSNCHITQDFHCSLKFMLACACYMRLSSCFHLDSDAFNNGISVAPKNLSVTKKINGNTCNPKWFMPVGLYTVLCQNLMRVRKGARNHCEINKNIHSEKFDLPREDNPWICKLQTLHSAGRYTDCLHILQQEIGEDTSGPEIIRQFVEHNATAHNDGLKLPEVIADVYDCCSKPAIALEVFLHLNEISDNDISRLKLAKIYTSLGEYEQAQKILSKIENKVADYHYLSGNVYTEQGHQEKAERCLVEALHLYHKKASKPGLYDYYGYPIANDLIEPREIPDLRTSAPEKRLDLIQAASTDIIECVRRLGYVYSQMYRINLHKAYNKKVQDLLQVVYGDEALVANLALLSNNLAVDFHNIHDHEQSEQHYLRAFETCAGLYGKNTDHTDTALVLSNLGVLYKNMGDYSRADGYNRRALSMYRNVYGETSTHRHIIRVMRNQAGNYKSQKQCSEAREVLDQTLVMLRERHGADTDHSDIAESLRRIGTIHIDIEQYSKADDYLHQALHMYQRIHGPDSKRDKALVLENIAQNHDEHSDYSRAVEFYNRALVMYTDVYCTDSNNGDIANVLHGLGLVNYHMGHYSKCVELYNQSLNMYREIYNADSNHIDVAQVLNNLGTAHYMMKEYGTAEDCYYQSLEIRRAIYGTDCNHVDIADVLYNLALCYDATGEKDEANDKYREALLMYRAVQPDHKNVVRISDALKSRETIALFYKDHPFS